MTVYVISGKLGTGKGLHAANIIREFIKRGRYVATNLDVFTENMFPPWNDSQRLLRLPDLPTASDLHALPRPTKSKNFKFFGALVLDELSVFLNSHGWNEDGRPEFRAWCANARKLGWHVYFICQNPDQIDKQIRESFIEYHTECFALPLSFIPFLGGLISSIFTDRSKEEDENTNEYRIHFSRTKLGFGQNAVKVARSFIPFPKSLYLAYDTNQVYFKGDKLKANGTFTYLSAYKIRGRYMGIWQMNKPLILASSIFCLIFGLLLGYFFTNYQLKHPKTNPDNSPVPVHETFDSHTQLIGVTYLPDSLLATVKRPDGNIESYTPQHYFKTAKGICIHENNSFFGNDCPAS